MVVHYSKKLLTLLTFDKKLNLNSKDFLVKVIEYEQYQADKTNLGHVFPPMAFLGIGMVSWPPIYFLFFVHPGYFEYWPYPTKEDPTTLRNIQKFVGNSFFRAFFD